MSEYAIRLPYLDATELMSSFLAKLFKLIHRIGKTQPQYRASNPDSRTSILEPRLNSLNSFQTQMLCADATFKSVR